ncbi:MAG: leucine-rich repeat protein [Thermoguttaceae bacterium]|nr:leucine-rich repeat protein [Thermoguttaceae bacterium]
MPNSPMKKQALLIGINEYQILPGLKYARQDAEAVADSLKQNYCFSDNEIMLLTDARPGLFKPTNRYIIQDHLEKLANQELDLFIFGFWGHGLFRNGKRYLCPLDVMTARAEYQGLPFDELQELLANIHAKNTCLILDCCQTIHDRGEAETLTAFDQTSMENAARDIVFRRKTQIPNFQSNVAILNSCKEGQSAYEWDARQHGLFTAHLLDAMNKRCTSVLQIASYISSNIEKTAMELGKEQTPFYRLEGDIVLPVATKSSPLVTGDVFISYRHCNADLVAPIEEELKKQGISYFIDRVGVNYSMDYSTVLAQAIKACKVLLVVWTKEAKDSPDMLQEIVVAKQLKKRVLPYKLGSFDVTEHDALFYQLAPLSRREAAVQTPETIADVVNQIELVLTGKSYPQPTSKLPETLQDADIQQPVIENINTTVPPTQNEQSQSPISKLPETTQGAVFQQSVIEDKNETVQPAQIEQSQPPISKLPDTIQDVDIQQPVIEDNNEIVPPVQNEQIQPSISKLPEHTQDAVIQQPVIEDIIATIPPAPIEQNHPIPQKKLPSTSQSPFEWDGTKIKKFIGKEKEVIIPEGTTEIGYRAFRDCSSLTSVVIPDGVTKIGNCAFENCSSLTSVVIPKSVTEIGNYAFYGCSSLTSVVIPEGLTEIERGAFQYCSSLISVAIPKSVRVIEKGAFEYCSSITSVVIPEGLTEIGERAFSGCSSLTSIVIPRSVRIGYHAFEDCPVSWFSRMWWHK